LTAQDPTPSQDPRPRGRPRLEIDSDAVAEAVAQLISEGGLDALSFNDVAEKLAVSRATLYRTIPTKENLLAVLLERSMKEMSQLVADSLEQHADPSEQLLALVELQIDAAIRMRWYMPLFFGQGDMPAETYAHWQTWVRDLERAWVAVVKRNMEAGALPAGEPVITTRLLLGATLWVSRWYRPEDRYTPRAIRRTAVELLKSLRVDAPGPQGPPVR